MSATHFKADPASHRFKNIVVLSGAGISAESGIPTFRGMKGLWNDVPIEKVATPEGFLDDPTLVHEFYNSRRVDVQQPAIQPNAGHLALAEWEKRCEGSFVLVTQNIDDLHERAGSKNILHMHGELLKIECTNCRKNFVWTTSCGIETACPGCQTVGKMRPYVVWFGEIPRFMEEIEEAIENADVFVAIGTSGQVYPAAGFGRMARRHGAHTVEVNLESTGVSYDFVQRVQGSASVTLPKLVEEWLKP